MDSRRPCLTRLCSWACHLDSYSKAIFFFTVFLSFAEKNMCTCAGMTRNVEVLTLARKIAKKRIFIISGPLRGGRGWGMGRAT